MVFWAPKLLHDICQTLDQKKGRHYSVAITPASPAFLHPTKLVGHWHHKLNQEAKTYPVNKVGGLLQCQDLRRRDARSRQYHRRLDYFWQVSGRIMSEVNTSPSLDLDIILLNGINRFGTLIELELYVVTASLC